MPFYKKTVITPYSEDENKGLKVEQDKIRRKQIRLRGRVHECLEVTERAARK